MSAAVTWHVLEKRKSLYAELLSGYKLHWSCCWLPGPPHWDTLPNIEANTEERGAGVERLIAGILDPDISDLDSPEISFQLLEPTHSFWLLLLSFFLSMRPLGVFVVVTCN